MSNKSWTRSKLIILVMSAVGNTVFLHAAPLTVALTPGWATFGQALPQGFAPSAAQVGTLSTQTDVKTTWPDGSIKFAVLTVNSLTSGTYPISAGSPSGIAFTPNNVPIVTVVLNMGGADWTAQFPAAPSTDRWLNGPSAIEWRYLMAPKDSTGKLHSFVRVLLDERLYQDGQGRADITIENTLDQSDATRVTYNLTISVGGQPLYTKSNVAQPYLTRGRIVVPFGSFSPSQVTPDFEGAHQAHALPRFLSSVTPYVEDVSSPDCGTLVFAPADPISACLLAQDMTAHGGRDELGLYPTWAARFIVHRSPQFAKPVLTQGDLSGTWPIHLREPDGPVKPGGSTFQGVGALKIVSRTERPLFWLDNRQGAPNMPAADPANFGSGYDPTPVPLPASPLWPDIAHQPSIAYIPYLATGDRYYGDELAFWAEYDLIRSYEQSDANNGMKGLLTFNEVRGIGWSLRNLTDAAAYSYDPTLRAYFGQMVTNNLAELNSIADADNSPFGTLWPIRGDIDPVASLAQWECNYVAWAIDHANKQGFIGGLRHRDKIAKFQLKMFTSDPDFPKQDGAPYVVSVGNKQTNGSITWFTTIADIFNKGTNGNTRDFSGYYGVDARLSLMIGIENNWPGAQAAYDYLWPFIGANTFWNCPGNLPGSDEACRPQWAQDFDTPSSPPPPLSNPPTVATAAKATPSPVTGKTTALTVLGADDGGEINLTYTWSTTGTAPAAVTFSATNGTHAGQSVTATFSKAGTYSLQATIKDADGLTVTSPVSVTVNQTLTTVTVAPAVVSVKINTTQSFTATGQDQFGNPLTAQPTFAWTVSGGGTIGATTGIFTAGSTVGSFTVTAATGTIKGTASVTVTVNTPPTVSLGSPAPSSTFQAPATISFTATAADSDGTVSKVEFFQGTTSLGQDTSSPYSYTWSNVAAGNYELFARATDNLGGITESTHIFISVTTPVSNPPSIPTGLTATAGNTQVQLSWNANTESDLAGYIVYWSLSANGPFYALNTTPTMQTTYTHTGLFNGTPYYYQVAAVNQAGQASAMSPTVVATPQSAVGGGPTPENNSTPDYSITPNPCEKCHEIFFTSTHAGATVDIFTRQGKKIASSKPLPLTFSTDGIASGIYLAVFHSEGSAGGKSSTKKMKFAVAR